MEEKKLNETLEFDKTEFYYLVSNLAFDRNHWYINSKFERILDLDYEKQLDYIINYDGEKPWWRSEDENKALEILSKYFLSYFIEVFNKLINREISFEYLLSLNGLKLIGYLLYSEKIRNMFIDFLFPLIEKKERLPYPWKIVIAIIIEEIFTSELSYYYKSLKQPFEEKFGSFSLFEDWIETLKKKDYNLYLP